MSFFNKYLQHIIKYDSINALSFKEPKQLPKLKKIVLNFGYQKSNFKRLISGLLALEFLTSQKGKITKSKHLNIMLKIKQGTPVGCKLTLRKRNMHKFYLKLMTSVFTKLKKPRNERSPKSCKSVSIVIQSPLIFMELENHYEIFKDIPQLDVTLVTNTKSKNELLFFLRSVKIFL